MRGCGRRVSLFCALGVLGAGLAGAGPALGFCGFFVAGSDAKLTNHASQVVLLREGRRTVITMSNTYQGPPEDFAMVVPVPVVLKKEDVKTLPADVFDHIDALSAPRLVEYWEQDPCDQRRYEMKKSKGGPGGPPIPAPSARAAAGDYGVKIEARFAVGEYEIVILSAKDSGGLERWLTDNRYKIPQGAGEALGPYVRDQMKFFVAKVNIQKVKKNAEGLVVLSPLRVAFEAEELRLPVRLGLLNAAEKQDLIVYVLHPESRFEVANYPNVFIPTNLEVVDEVRKSFPAFYAELFDATIEKMNRRAVVTEYAWQTTSCDPCPTPPLQPGDLATLGAGLDGQGGQGGPGGPGGPAVQPGWKGRSGRGGFYGGFAPWVLTRLHTRYDRATLQEDLIFRMAKPVTGGRAGWDGSSSDAGAQVSDGGTNNFQGRYIIRHYWTGPVKCQNPQYGVWGGPPGGEFEGRSGMPQAARGLGLAPRGKVALKNVVQSPIPSLGLPGRPPPRRGR
jgi:hypothetical protein